jgi:transposase
MYLRSVKVKAKEGAFHEYLRLVESYREDGKVKQRVFLNLGRRDILAPHLGALVRLLSQPGDGYVRVRDVQPVSSWDWGPIRAAHSLWQELGLGDILDRLLGPGRPGAPAPADRCFVLVANRLCAPSSEHGLARWLEEAYLCDRKGRRWVACWRDDEQRRRSKTPRVRVEPRQLQRWYRTLDQLHAYKEQIEKQLYLRLRDLFSLKIDLAFYDVTSTYFEGHGPEPLAAHGYSRDHQPRKRQVVVGVVMVDGWPIAHHVFSGNTRDSTTVPAVLADLQQRFGIGRVIFVGDRGMVTSDNLELLRSEKHGYVVGLNRRRNEKVFGYLQRVTDDWIECPVGITAQEKSTPPRTRVQEVPSNEKGVRVFVVDSEERLAYEQAERLKAMQRVQERLERLKKRVEEGRIKAPHKVGAAAARILGENHGTRYYDWEYRDGTFRYFEHPRNLTREKAYEGKYIIQTEEQSLSPVEAVQIYKNLTQVERAFRDLKDVIDMRPIYHQTPARTEAHIFVATLALLLHRGLEKKLDAAGLDLSASEALKVLKTVRVVDIDLGEGRQKRGATKGSTRCRPILTALGLTNLEAPAQPEHRPRIE